MHTAPTPLVLAGWTGFCAEITATAPTTFTLRLVPMPERPCAGAGAPCATAATLHVSGTAVTVCATCAARLGAAAGRAGLPAPIFTPLG